MAVIKAGRGPLDMVDLGFSFNGQVSASPTNVRVTFDIDDFIDFGGAYSFAGGTPSGTVTSITNTVAGFTDFTVTGANSDANTLFGLIDAGLNFEATAYVLRADDTIVGRGRGDTLYGFAGDDVIRSGGGADTLVGGVGADRLEGGADNDTFAFLATSDSTVAAAGRDKILDFSAREGDKIDLAAIDAIAGGGDDAFMIVNRFHDVAGELVIKAANGGFLVQGDTDGVGGADFAVFVNGMTAPDGTDFNL